MKNKYLVLILCGFIVIISSILIPTIFNRVFSAKLEEKYILEDNEKFSNYSNINLSLLEFDNFTGEHYREDWGGILLRDSSFKDERSFSPVIMDFEYIYTLLLSNETDNIERANKIINRIFSIDVAKWGSIYSQTIFGGYNGYGGFHEIFPQYAKQFDKYPPINPYFVFRVIPYLISIYEDFSPDINQDNIHIFSQSIPLIIDTVLRNQPTVDQLDYYLQKIASVLILILHTESWNLYSQAIDLVKNLYESLLVNPALLNVESESYISILLSLKLIHQNCPYEIKPIIEKISRDFVDLNNLNLKYNEKYQVISNPLENGTLIDLHLLTMMNETSLIEQFSQLNALEDNELDAILSDLDTERFLPIILLYLIISISAIILIYTIFNSPLDFEIKDLKQYFRENNQIKLVDKRIFPIPINYYSEIFSTIGFFIISIIFVSTFHYEFSFYLFIFAWPIVFLYGWKNNEMFQILSIFWFIVLISLSIFSIQSQALISIMNIYVFVWILEIVQNLVFLILVINKKGISHGHFTKATFFILLIIIASEIMYLTLFLSNNYKYFTANFLTFGILFKAFVIFRGKYG